MPTVAIKPWPLPDIASVGPTVATERASATQNGSCRRGNWSGSSGALGVTALSSSSLSPASVHDASERMGMRTLTRARAVTADLQTDFATPWSLPRVCGPNGSRPVL